MSSCSTRAADVYKTASLNESVSGLEFVGNTGKLAIAGPEFALWQYDTAKCCDYSLSLPEKTGNTLVADPRNPAEFVATSGDGIFILTVDHAGKPHRVLLSSVITIGAQFSPDGNEVVTTNDGGSVDIYRVATRKVLATFSARGTTAVNSAFSPDRSLLPRWNGPPVSQLNKQIQPRILARQ
jgi:WD40 repeat protein